MLERKPGRECGGGQRPAQPEKETIIKMMEATMPTGSAYGGRLPLDYPGAVRVGGTPWFVHVPCEYSGMWRLRM